MPKHRSCTINSIPRRARFRHRRPLLNRFADELYDYVDSAASLQSPKLLARSAERVSFACGTDFFGAGLATLRTTLTMLALGAFWIESSWPAGASAMILATVFAGLFATAPNPTRTTTSVMLGYAIGMFAGFFAASSCCR